MTGLTILAPLVLIICLGMALRSFGFLGDADRERLTRLLYWIVLPALLFRTTYMAGGDLSQHTNLFLATYAAYFAAPAFALAVSLFAHRGNRGIQALSALAAARANNLYLGVPAVALALGDRGLEAASIYVAIALPGYNVISILWGEAIISGGLNLGAARSVAARVVKNPLIISSVLGLLFAQLRIPVPETLLVSMRLVGNMATGVALIALGQSLGLGGFPAALRRTWTDVLIRLIVYPAIAWGFLRIWPVPEIFFQAAMIISAMPTAVNTFILAGGMGMDERYACELVAMSTVFSLVSIPLWVALIGVG